MLFRGGGSLVRQSIIRVRCAPAGRLLSSCAPDAASCARCAVIDTIVTCRGSIGAVVVEGRPPEPTWQTVMIAFNSAKQCVEAGLSSDTSPRICYEHDHPLVAQALELKLLKDVPKQQQFSYDLSKCFPGCEAAFFVKTWQGIGDLLLQVVAKLVTQCCVE